MTVAYAPHFLVKVHAHPGEFIDAVNNVELQIFLLVWGLIETDILVFFALNGLPFLELAVIGLLEGDFTDAPIIDFISIKPGIEILAVVLGPDFLGYPGFSMTEGDIVLDSHYLVVAVSFQVKHIIAMR